MMRYEKRWMWRLCFAHRARSRFGVCKMEDDQCCRDIQLSSFVPIKPVFINISHQVGPSLRPSRPPHARHARARQAANVAFAVYFSIEFEIAKAGEQGRNRSGQKMMSRRQGESGELWLECLDGQRALAFLRPIISSQRARSALEALSLPPPPPPPPSSCSSTAVCPRSSSSCGRRHHRRV